RPGLPDTGDPALARGSAKPQPARLPKLEPDKPSRGPVAPATPHPAPLPRRALPRSHPRQEPSALAAHAGICAGGRPQGRSLPRSPCSGKVHGQVVHIRLPSRYSRQMPLDADLLNQAKTAEARVIDAEQAAEIARAEFHGTVRRLQLAGASLREIAEALGLSHQRVHQIVEAA